MDKNKLDSFFWVSYEAIFDRYPGSRPDLLILESNPEVDYYGQHTPEVKATPLEHHLFVLAEQVVCFVDNCFKCLYEFEQANNVKLHVYPGHLQLGDKTYMILRFREKELETVMKYIEYLRNKMCYKFKKDTKFTRRSGQVFYKKYMDLEEIYEDIYKDRNSKSVYFIKLPRDIGLENLYKLADYIKYSGDFCMFEPFYAYTMVRYYEVHYFFMFYSPHCSQENIPRFKELLYKGLAHI